MKFGHLEIYSSDPKVAQKFYCDVLGFKIEAVQNEQFIWLKKGEMEILIRLGSPPPPVSRYEEAPTGFVFYTNNLDETLKNLVDRGLEIKGTIDSSKCYTFTDPDGNWFQLVDPNDH